MNTVTFTQPLWLALTPVLALLAWRRWRAARGVGDWRAVCEHRLLRALAPGAPQGRSGPPWSLMALAALVPLALAGPARPGAGGAPAPGADARVVVLDLSLSMLATDLAPSRLSRARAVTDAVLASAREGRTALVVFAGVASPVMPLTTDATTLRAVLPLLDPTVLAYQGSRPDLGLDVAGTVLEGGGAERGEVILVTDGGPAERAVHSAERLRRDGHRVTVLAVGTAAGGPVRLPDGEALLGVDGSPVRPRVDGAGLRTVAAAGGGGFAWLNGRDDGAALRVALARPFAGDRRGSAPREDPSHFGPWVALAALVPALFALRGAGLSGFARASAGMSAMLFVVLSLPLTRPAAAFGWDDLWARPAQRAARALARGGVDALRGDEGWQWRGAALHRAGRFDEAADAYAWDGGATAHYNRGTALARAGRLGEALEAFDRTLVLDPTHADATHNRAVVAAALERERRTTSAAPDGGDSKREPAGRTARPSAPGTGGARQGTSDTANGRADGPAHGSAAAPGSALWFDSTSDRPGPDGVGAPVYADSAENRDLERLEALLLEIRDDPAEVWRIKLSRGHHGRRLRLPGRSDAW